MTREILLFGFDGGNQSKRQILIFGGNGIMFKFFNTRTTTDRPVGQGNLSVLRCTTVGSKQRDWSSRRRRLHADCPATDGIYLVYLL